MEQHWVILFILHNTHFDYISFPWKHYKLIISVLLADMFRFLFKWSLEITGTSLVGYHMLSPQKRADLQGMGRSITNSSRTSLILLQSVYDYYR